MPVATMTKLGARDDRALDEVVELTAQVLARLEVAPGFLGGRLLLDGRSAWTLTLWADAAAVRAFGRDHAPVAGQGPRLAGELLLTSWRTAGERVPSWADAAARWPYGAGPSPDGLSGDVPPARVAVGA